jgi:hypothetical protein
MMHSTFIHSPKVREANINGLATGGMALSAATILGFLLLTGNTIAAIYRSQADDDAAAVDVLPLIAYHGGTRNSCSGFGVCWNSTVNVETTDLYWFGPSIMIE